MNEVGDLLADTGGGFDERIDAPSLLEAKIQARIEAAVLTDALRDRVRPLPQQAHGAQGVRTGTTHAVRERRQSGGQRILAGAARREQQQQAREGLRIGDHDVTHGDLLPGGFARAPH